MKRLSRSWDILTAGGVLVGFLVTGFLLPPPVGDTLAGESQLFRAAQVGTTLFVGLMAVPVVWRRGRAGARIWSALALAFLFAGIASYLAYKELAEAWTVPYGQVLIVTGSVLTPNAQDYLAENPGASESQMVMDLASGADGVWTRESIARRRRVLAAIYVLALPLLAASLIAMIQAIACSIGWRDPSARREQPEAEVRAETLLAASSDLNHTTLNRGPAQEDGFQKLLPPSRTILILASNPRNTDPLRLVEEVKKIELGLERAKKRDQFKLVQKWSVTDDDLRRALLDHEPEIVHFAGHGTRTGQSGVDRDLVPSGKVEMEGLVFEEDSGHMRIISKDALARLFELCADHVKCVVLNACYSEVQAKAIAQHIDHVVGMNKAIGDDAAIKFAVGFYEALGAGRDFEAAHKFGCIAIDLTGMPDYLTPVFLKRSNRG